LVKSDGDGINPGIKSENLKAIKSIANKIRADIYKGTKKVQNLIDTPEYGFYKDESLNEQSVFLKLSVALYNTNHLRRFMRKKHVF